MSDAPRVILTTVLASLSAAATRALDENPLPAEFGQPQFRRMQAAVQKGGYDAENHTVTMTVSSETPIERYGGYEVLSHAPGAIDTGRLDQGIPYLFNHNWDAHLGRSQAYAIKDGKLSITNRFGTNPLAKEKEQDVADEILVDVSIGYQPTKVDITEDKNGVRTYFIAKWVLFENSSVTVPADYSVGVNRSTAGVTEVEVSFRKLDSDDTDPEGDEGEGEDLDDEERTRAAEAAAVATPEVTTSSTDQPTQQRTQTMATVAVVADPAADNKTRIEGLRALRTQYGTHYSETQLLDDLSGTRSVTDVRTAIADAIIKQAENSHVPTASERLFGAMSQRERDGYSLRNVYARAINERMPGTFMDKGSEAGFEREVSQELRKDAAVRGITDLGGGILVPSANSRVFAPQLAQERTIASGGNAGTATNFTTVVNEVIELLRYRTALLSMGARYMPGLHGAFQMPGQTGAATSSWLTEGSAVTSSDPTLGSSTMQPKRMSIANSYFRDFLAQSGLAIDGFLANDRQNVTARSLDSAGLAGSGVLPVPLGLLNRSGLAAILAGTTRAANGTVTAGAGGVPMTFVDYNNMEAAISTNNGDIGTMGIITTPKVRAGGRSTPKTPGTNTDYVWPTSPVANGVQEGPLGYRSLVTANPVLTGFTANSVSNLHAVIMGVFDQIVIGDWDLSEVVIDPYTGAANAMVKITEHAYYDIFVRQLAAFCVCTSALPQ
jgi:HK97 family phage prohead protease